MLIKIMHLSSIIVMMLVGACSSNDDSSHAEDGSFFGTNNADGSRIEEQVISCPDGGTIVFADLPDCLTFYKKLESECCPDIYSISAARETFAKIYVCVGAGANETCAKVMTSAVWTSVCNTFTNSYSGCK